MTDHTAIIERMARAIGETYDGSADPVETPNNWARAVSAAEEALSASGLLEVLEKAEGVEFMFRRDDECSTEHFDRKAMRFYRETGIWPPGKSMPMELNLEQAEMSQFTEWQSAKVAALRNAIKGVRDAGNL